MVASLSRFKRECYNVTLALMSESVIWVQIWVLSQSQALSWWCQWVIWFNHWWHKCFKAPMSHSEWIVSHSEWTVSCEVSHSEWISYMLNVLDKDLSPQTQMPVKQLRWLWIKPNCQLSQCSLYKRRREVCSLQGEEVSLQGEDVDLVKSVRLIISPV